MAELLSAEQRDRLADAIRHEWSGGRYKDVAWADLPSGQQERWRTEVDLLPIEAVIREQIAQGLRDAAAAHEEQQKADARRYGVHRPWTDAVNFLNRRADRMSETSSTPASTAGGRDE